MEESRLKLILLYYFKSMITYIMLTNEEYINLITSYKFISEMDFYTKNEVIGAIEFCKQHNKLSEDTLNYLLEKIQTLPDVETTESNQDWEITGASAN